jgi:hypothetical protein
MFSKQSVTTTELVRQNITTDALVKRHLYFAREYPSHVPTLVQFNGDSMIHRYVLPRDSTFGHFMIAFRRKIQINASEAIIPLIEKEVFDKDNKQVVTSFQIISSKTIDDIARDFIHRDGYLYVNVTLQNTFG